MKCIVDGTSRTMLSELEGQALQLWDIVGFNGLPRYVRKRNSALAPMKHDNEDNASAHDESAQSSPACYTGGGSNSGTGVHVKEEMVLSDYALDQQQNEMLEQQRYHNNHSTASQRSVFNDSQLEEQASGAGGEAADASNAVGDDDEADEYDEEENSNPLQEVHTPIPQHSMLKRRKG